MNDMIERIWEYSRFYGNLLFSANRLSKNGESYAAFLVLFNAVELICKSLRETDESTVAQDIDWLAENGFFTEEEKEYLNGETGIRKIRNIITHRNPFAYFLNVNGIMYPFADMETWDFAYQQYAPKTIKALFNAIEHLKNT